MQLCWRLLGGLTAAVSAALVGAALAMPEAPRRPVAGNCDHFRADRQAFFGDLHVHTALSLDASTQGTRTRPADAYAFAQGAPLWVQPFDAAGQGSRRIQLREPLDFAAVTDHAELMGEVHLCQDPLLDPWARLGCRVYRGAPRLAFFWMNAQASVGHGLALCGPDRRDCLAAVTAPWTEVLEAAEAANEDRGRCRFTAFAGYEWTGAEDGGNLHRNVIFEGDSVPSRPIDFYAASSALALHTQLRAACGPGSERPECRAVVIPHNGNLSKGRMFSETGPGGAALYPDAEAARRWAELEPVVEIMQHKGQSECWPGSADEQCGFEPLPYRSLPDKFLPGGGAPEADAGFARQVLLDGLSIEEELGDNPFRLGFIGSTDTHLGTPGAADEVGFLGHGGAGVPADQAQGFVDELEFNPGGLAGVWAEENSRAALFSALQRREVFATSGPRLTVRVFGGEALPSDYCERPDRAAQGYAAGVPMGGVVDGAGRFELAVEAHSAFDGHDLERVQVVRGRIVDGEPEVAVFDVAGSPSRESVDTATCTPVTSGVRRLCTVWQDPDFEPDVLAVYYVRVLETPSCRWSQHTCAAAEVDCAAGKPPRGLEGCCVDHHQPVIQERAWASPVWTRPGAR